MDPHNDVDKHDRAPSCPTHGDPLVCLACEADEDLRPVWQQPHRVTPPRLRGEPERQEDPIPQIDCPLCGLVVRQVSSATLSLALWQHFNWMHTPESAGVLALQRATFDSENAATEARIAERPDGERLRQQAVFISETLQHAGVGPCSLTEGVQGIVQQRDELLAALRAVVTMYGPSSDYGHEARAVWEQAEATITKAEAK